MHKSKSTSFKAMALLLAIAVWATGFTASAAAYENGGGAENGSYTYYEGPYYYNGPYGNGEENLPEGTPPPRG